MKTLALKINYKMKLLRIRGRWLCGFCLELWICGRVKAKITNAMNAKKHGLKALRGMSKHSECAK